MGFVRPSLVVDSTNTSGIGSYTLLGADPGDGFRTLADAVTDGDAANSDTISYFVVDTTTKGATLQWEHGTGTISDSGATLARTSIIESSNGDTEVDWGVGGTRTVRFGAGTAGFALLAAAQTFTGVQTFSQTIALSAGARLANNFAGRLILDNAGIIRGQLYSTTTPTVRLDHVQSDGSTVDSRLELTATGATVTGTLAASGAITQGGTAVALQGVLSAPTGTRLLIGNAAAPSGWTIVASLADRTIMLTSTESEIDDTGGSWTTGITASTTVNGHALTVAEMPVHNHGIAISFTGTASNAIGQGDAVGDGGSQNTTSAGSGNAHSHTASTTVSSTSYRPAYYKAAFYQKS